MPDVSIEMKEEIEHSAETRSSIEEIRDMFSSQVATLQTQLAEAQTQLVAAQAEAAEAKEQVAAANAEAKEAKTQAAALQTQVEEAKTQVEGLQGQLAAAQAEAKEQVSEAQTQVEGLKTQVAAAQKEAAAAHKKLAEEVPSITIIVAVLTTLALVILAKANILTMPIAAGLIGLAIMCNIWYDNYVNTSKLAAVKGCVNNYVVAVNFDKSAAQSLHSSLPITPSHFTLGHSA